MTQTPQNNLAARALRKFVAVPRRFTSAFILLVVFFVWMSLLVYGGNYIGDDEPYGRCDCGVQLCAYEDAHDVFPLARIFGCSSLADAITFLLITQLALGLVFALIRERGTKVLSKWRFFTHLSAIFLSLLLVFIVSPRMMLGDSFISKATSFVFVLAFMAVPLVTGGIKEGKKELPVFLGRSLLAALGAVLAVIAAAAVYNFLLQRFLGFSHGEVVLKAIVESFIFTILFFWTFMAGIPEEVKNNQ